MTVEELRAKRPGWRIREAPDGWLYATTVNRFGSGCSAARETPEQLDAEIADDEARWAVRQVAV